MGARGDGPTKEGSKMRRVDMGPGGTRPEKRNGGVAGGSMGAEMGKAALGGPNGARERVAAGAMAEEFAFDAVLLSEDFKGDKGAGPGGIGEASVREPEGDVVHEKKLELAGSSGHSSGRFRVGGILAGPQ